MTTLAVSHKSSKCNIFITKCPIALNFDAEVKYQKVHKQIVNDQINTQTAFVMILSVSPNSLKRNISMNNCPIALKFSIEEYLSRVNMAHLVKSGQLRANMTK